MKAGSPVVAMTAALTILAACGELPQAPEENGAMGAGPPSARNDQTLPCLVEEDLRPDGQDLFRVTGSLIDAGHTWPLVEWFTVRDMDISRDRDGVPHGSFTMEIELNLQHLGIGDGAILQTTTEEVVCVEVAEHAGGEGSDIWMSTAAKGWATTPPGATHFTIFHFRDSPNGDRVTGRTIAPSEGDPTQYCRIRPDLSATDPSGLGPIELMPGTEGDVTVCRHPGRSL